ncbi:hypothetical protein B0H13DRAFT_2356332 [Mycena leptocephala]|nr:hypothetical protein B0H13DRAFT_2356332 [Mycena leptocephala]
MAARVPAYKKIKLADLFNYPTVDPPAGEFEFYWQGGQDGLDAEEEALAAVTIGDAAIKLGQDTVIVDETNGESVSFISPDAIREDKFGISISSLSTEYPLINLTKIRKDDALGGIFYETITPPLEGGLFLEHDPPPQPVGEVEVLIEIIMHPTRAGNMIKVKVNIPLRSELEGVWDFYAVTLMGWTGCDEQLRKSQWRG